MMASKGPELRDELQAIGPELHPHARELREPYAEMIAVRNDDVAELLEIGAERRQLGDEIRSRQLRVRRHSSEVRSAYSGAVTLASTPINTRSVPTAASPQRHRGTITRSLLQRSCSCSPCALCASVVGSSGSLLANFD